MVLYVKVLCMAKYWMKIFKVFLKKAFIFVILRGANRNWKRINLPEILKIA